MKIILALLILSLNTFGMSPQTKGLHSHRLKKSSRYILNYLLSGYVSKKEGESETKGVFTAELKNNQFLLTDNDTGLIRLFVSRRDPSIVTVDPDARFSLSPNGRILVIKNHQKIVGFDTSTRRSLFIMKGFEGRPIRDFCMYGSTLLINTVEDGKSVIELFKFDLKDIK